MVAKSLDTKLARIHADPHHCKDFILADAKDADMALAIGATGKSPEAHSGELRYRTLAEFRDIIVQIVEQKLVDIMLMAASTSEVLTLHKRIFDNSPVTPALFAPTTQPTSTSSAAASIRRRRPCRFAPRRSITSSAVISTARGRSGSTASTSASTALRSTMTRSSTARRWRSTSSSAWRPSTRDFHHFLEIFDPNRPEAVEASQVPGFINDAIVRTLGGVTAKGRPLFLKMVYHGPKAMEELVHYDPHLVVGILGGSAGTTYDAFKLLSEAKKHGASVALFGRKINNAENQLAFIRFLRLIADGEIAAEEAVQAYHGVLQQLGIKPHRSLADDMVLQTNVMNYGGTGKTISVPPAANGQANGAKHAACACQSAAKKASGSCSCTPQEKPATTNGEPDFSKMTAAQKVAYHRPRWDRILG